MTYELQRLALSEKVRAISAANFKELSLEVLHFQYAYNPVFREFIKLLKVDIHSIKNPKSVPFLPVSIFKNQVVQTGAWIAETTFLSSATTGSRVSRHAVRDLNFYLNNTTGIFEMLYGPLKDRAILALLPSYLERSGSSLVAMAQHFINQSGYCESGFFLDDFKKLHHTLADLEKRRIPSLLLGVSFGLLDFAEAYPIPLTNTIIMETGGMKGRRKERTRTELHDILKKAFQVPAIHSEYGMTELFSQAYSEGDGIFNPAPTMKVFTTEINDPLAVRPPGKTGLLCIADLANLDTCAFIATEDIGRVYRDGSFEVLGRMDFSEMRGCNLMVE